MRGVFGLMVLTAATTLITAEPAGARGSVRVYRGPLGRHGAIRIDRAGSRARVYFAVPCVAAGSGEAEQLLTSPPPRQGLLADGSLEPVQGYLRGGRLSIRETEPVETNEEFNTPPEATIAVSARITSHGITGILSLRQSQSPGLDGNPAETIPGCSSATVTFTARRSS
jgi:hypothetical protein